MVRASIEDSPSLRPETLDELPRLARSFYDRDVVSVARDLVGKVVIHETVQGRTAGRIVETEAYEQSEPAAHSFRGRTRRNDVMFGRAGFAYTYFSYGVHWMLNVVTGPVDFAAAVLIRAMEPLDGIQLMQARRRLEKRLALMNGPGKICQAMAIGAAEYGLDLSRGALTVRDAPSLSPLTAGPRIGITKATELPWRFCAASPYVSRP